MTVVLVVIGVVVGIAFGLILGVWLLFSGAAQAVARGLGW